MKILFEDLRITTEKKSYQTTQNNLEISLGMETENLNLAENSVEIEWKLRKFNDSIFSEGRKNIKIGSFETKLFLNNLLLNSIYVLEIYNPNSVEKTVIYTGNNINITDIVHPILLFFCLLHMHIHVSSESTVLLLCYYYISAMTVIVAELQ